MLRVFKQKRLLSEVRHIYKPTIHKISLNHSDIAETRLMIKILPNSIDEAHRKMNVEITAISTESAIRMFPSDLAVSYIPLNCNSVEVLWHPIKRSKVMRYCVLSMVAPTSPNDNFGLCSAVEKTLKHPRFHQLYCLYPKFE